MSQKAWHHIAQSWIVMTCMGDLLSPSCVEDIVQLNLWWQSEYQKVYFGITMDLSFVLCSKELRQLCDVWDPERNEF